MAACIVGPLTASAAAGTLYVDKDSVGGPCSDARASYQVSVTRPLCTIGRSIVLAPGGTQIFVRRGAYPQLKVSYRSQTVMNSIKAYPNEKPSVAGIAIDHSARWHIEGFRTTDISTVSTSSYIELVKNEMTPNGLNVGSDRVVGGDHLLIDSNYIHDLTIKFDPTYVGTRCNTWSSNAGVYPWCGYGLRLNRITNSTISRNHISNVPADGIQMAGARNVVIDGNEIDHVSPFVDPYEHSDGTQVIGANDSITIRRNFYHQVRALIIQDATSGWFAGQPTNVTIENNVLGDMHDFAMTLLNINGLAVTNNTAWTQEVRLNGVIGNASLRNNIFQELQNTTGQAPAYEDYNLVVNGYRNGAHDLATAPTFVNAAAVDYHLAQGSAGIDAGTAIGAPLTDKDGHARVGAPDMGAYEYVPR